MGATSKKYILCLKIEIYYLDSFFLNCTLPQSLSLIVFTFTVYIASFYVNNSVLKNFVFYFFGINYIIWLNL